MSRKRRSLPLSGSMHIFDGYGSARSTRNDQPYDHSKSRSNNNDDSEAYDDHWLERIEPGYFDNRDHIVVPGTKTTYYKHQHKGETPVFTVGNASIFGLSRPEAHDHWCSFDLLIDCADKPEDYASIMLPQEFEPLRKHEVSYNNVLALQWPDYSTPPLAVGFWIDLCAMLSNGPERKVALFCVGGHGRTGTALCALYMAHNKARAMDAILYVRKRHCHKAVESHSQCDYLCTLEGELFGDVTSDPVTMKDAGKPPLPSLPQKGRG